MNTIIESEGYMKPQNIMPMAEMPQKAQYGYHCIPQETCLCNVKLARAYVPFQKLCSVFPHLEGLAKGTIFPELFSPYCAPDKCDWPPNLM